MAYQYLNDNRYRCETCGPLGLQLALQYDPKTGDYRLVEKNLLGTGSAVFYQNGVWYSDAIRDPKLFEDGDPNKPTALSRQLSENLRKEVYSAYQAYGGQNKGNKVNNSALPQNQKADPGVTNAYPGTSPTVPGPLSAPPGQGNLLDPGLSIDVTEYFGGDNLKTIVKDKANLLYPLDILKTQQDTLQITQFTYKAPRGETFLTNKPIDTLTQGVQRNSALRDLIGTVVLPIPNNAMDSNNVSWGSDHMNNLTAAVTASYIQNPGAALTGTMAAQIPQLAGLPIPPAALAQIGAIMGAGGLQALNNPQAKTALLSLLLNQANFQVSPESILARGFGVIPNSNLELLFNSPTIRQFSFAYRLSPRSEEESRNVRKIIRFFKQGMAPRKITSQAGGNSLLLGTPNVFKLQYKTVGDQEIEGMNKFKICALVGYSVNYSPDGQWAAYDKGQPVSVTMNMQFEELEPIYNTDYQESGPLITSGDQSKVGPNDVGY